MSFTIITGKELTAPPRPLILCQITAVDSDTVYLTTAASQGNNFLAYGGHNYLCKIRNQVIEQIQAQSPQGYDIPGSITLEIADGDFALWTNHANAHGWRGGTLKITFVLWDIPTNAYSTDAYSWNFIAGKPKIKAATGVITLEAQALESMTRLKVPNVPRQNRCPWVFPADAAQRAEGQSDPSSVYYQCGYSPDVSGGVGNYESGTTPFTDCDYTRQTCIAHGMFSTDSSARETYRFGGDTWLPAQEFKGKKYTTSANVVGFNTLNNAPGQFYNLLYGAQWVDCTVLEPAGEPNSLRSECVVCVACDGPVKIITVLVNGVQVPQNNTADPLFTWRFNGAGGGRNGAINTDAIFDGNGDPHGSLCVIEVVVPVELAAGGSVPHVQALAQGPPIATFVDLGTGIFPPNYQRSSNPVWQLVDLLTWGPWKYSMLDLATFCVAAAVCDVPVSYTKRDGTTGTHERYRSSFVLAGTQRQTLAAAVLALRNNAGMILSKNPTTGLLQCFIEQTLADQQPAPVPGSNYNTAVASVSADGTTTNGYLAYLFDGADSIENGTFELNGLSINDTPNVVNFPFQDEDNTWQQDSISTIDEKAYISSGNQEINVPLQIAGIANFDQGTRRSNVELAKSLYGNSRFDSGGTELPEFMTTFKAAHLKPGMICGLTYEQLGI